MNNIVIEPDGTITFIYSDDLADMLDLGTARVQRASHVEPVAGGWTADMSPVGGPVLLAAEGKPFKLRSEALEAEVAWLNCHLLNGSGDRR